MKLKNFALCAAFMAASLPALAQKSHFIPYEWTHPYPSDSLLYAKEDPNNEYTWSESRSIESDNVIIYWDKYYGDTAPNKLSSSNFYYVDIEDLLQKCEAFYELESTQLGFVDPETSNISKYKIMVLLNHTTTWTCYGGGYDFSVPALWLNPATCKPVGSAVAHEVGHSFHYMCYSEASNYNTLSGVETGFHTALGNGQAIWETTANWQALQSYPAEIFTQSSTGWFFSRTHNLAFSHEWHRYQAYMFLVYLSEYYNDIQTVANVWNTAETSPVDFNQALMDCKGLSVRDLYKLHFDFACHAATYDMKACEDYRSNYVGNFLYHCSLVADSTYQVAYASAPQSTGFNIIPLQVPDAGTEVTTNFTALRPGSKLTDSDPVKYWNGDTFKDTTLTKYNSVSIGSQRAFRLGYVLLMQDGTRKYIAEDSLYCQGSGIKTCDVSMTVPEGVDQMWLVVAPAPKKYIQHKWDEEIGNDDQWPYQVHFSGTDIGSKATVYASPTIDGRAIGDITFTYDVTFPASSSVYAGASVALDVKAQQQLGTAFQLQTSEIADKMVTYASGGPSAGKIMFYAAKPSGSLYQKATTANGYGYWFSKAGAPVEYASGYVYSEFTPSTLTFNLGQYPGKCSTGDTFTVAEVLRYRDANNQYAKALFIFNITISDETSVTLTNVEYDEEKAVGISAVQADQLPADGRIYDLTGRQVANPTHGIYIQNGKKFYVK